MGSRQTRRDPIPHNGVLQPVDGFFLVDGQWFIFKNVRKICFLYRIRLELMYHLTFSKKKTNEIFGVNFVKRSFFFMGHRLLPK